MKKITLHINYGFTLIEVMVTLFILLVVLLGIASSQIAAIKGNIRAFHINKTLLIAQNKLEEFYPLSYDTPILNTGNHTEKAPPAGYQINWKVIDGSVSNTKQIIVTAIRTTVPKTKVTLSTIKAQL